MRQKFYRILMLLGCVVFTTGYAHAVYQVIDSTGHLIQLNQLAQRIITLAPNLAEMVDAVGAGKNLVGVSASTTDLPAAKNKPIVATNSDIDIERILALHPDLVIAWQGGNPTAQLNKLQQLHIPVYIASFHQLRDIPKTILNIGHLTNHDARAESYVRRFIQHYVQLKLRYSQQKPVTVFYQLSQKPLVTLNDQTLVGQVIHLCGGKNIFGRAISLAPEINVASVLQANPSVIFISQKPVRHSTDLSRFWQHYPMLTAVNHHDVLLASSNLIERYSPNMLASVDVLCRQINAARCNHSALNLETSISTTSSGEK